MLHKMLLQNVHHKILIIKKENNYNPVSTYSRHKIHDKFFINFFKTKNKGKTNKLNTAVSNYNISMINLIAQP